MVKFLRRAWSRYAKLGKGRKKKQVWRKPTGRDNKMREKRKGYPAVVSIGYRSNRELRAKLKEKIPVKVYCIKDLEKIIENEIVIVGKIGKRKKIEMVKKAKEMKIEMYNINPKKFLKLNVKNKQKEEKKWI